MFSHSHMLKNGFSAYLAALVLCVWGAPVRLCPAAEDVPALVDEGIAQILTDEITQRMAKFLESYDITGLESLSITGTFRSLSSDALEQQMTKAFGRRSIVVDGSTRTKLEGTLTVTQTKEAVIVVMKCTLSESGGSDLCTLQVRKVLPARSGS